MKIHKNLQESCQNLWSLEASNIFLFMISNWSTHNIEESLKEVEWSERHVQESSQISGKDPANMRSSPRFSINLTRQYWYLKNPPSISEASQNRLERGGESDRESWRNLEKTPDRLALIIIWQLMNLLFSFPRHCGYSEFCGYCLAVLW